MNRITAATLNATMKQMLDRTGLLEPRSSMFVPLIKNEL